MRRTTLRNNYIKKEILSICYELASKSPDKSNQNGAVVVDSYDYSTIIAGGRNEFPSSTEVTDELINDREKKLFYIEHAERNAIFSAVNNKKEVSGNTLFCPWFACSDCAKAILLCGITRVIGHQQRMDQTPERWKASVAAGLDMLTKHGVILEFLDEKLGCKSIIVNGQTWQP